MGTYRYSETLRGCENESKLLPVLGCRRIYPMYPGHAVDGVSVRVAVNLAVDYCDGYEIDRDNVSQSDSEIIRFNSVRSPIDLSDITAAILDCVAK